MIVYLSEYIHPEAEKLLRKYATVVDRFDDAEQVDAIILRAARIDRDIISRATKLKVISKHGIGCDSIDLEAAKEFGIPVVNTPFANVNSVAELIVGLILNVSRKISQADAGCRKEAYTHIAPPELTGTEVSGKIAGLIGMGNIARRTAEILHSGFDVEVRWYDPFLEADKVPEYRKCEDLKELIQISDIINVSVPLTPSTKDLISGDLFDSFKKNAILINAARGGIVNEEDLYTALKTGKLRCAACDSFVTEPPTGENRLLELDNFCATPHIGAATEEALYRMGMESVENVLKTVNGEVSGHRVV